MANNLEIIRSTENVIEITTIRAREGHFFVTHNRPIPLVVDHKISINRDDPPELVHTEARYLKLNNDTIKENEKAIGTPMTPMKGASKMVETILKKGS